MNWPPLLHFLRTTNAYATTKKRKKRSQISTPCARIQKKLAGGLNQVTGTMVERAAISVKEDPVRLLTNLHHQSGEVAVKGEKGSGRDRRLSGLGRWTYCSLRSLFGFSDLSRRRPSIAGVETRGSPLGRRQRWPTAGSSSGLRRRTAKWKKSLIRTWRGAQILQKKSF